MNFKIQNYLCLIIFIIYGNRHVCASVSAEVNRGCSDASTDCDLPWIIEVVNTPAGTPNGTEFHHLWGGVGAPTLITAQTLAGANLTVHWDRITAHKDKAIELHPMPLNVFGISVTEVILFDDQSDTGSISSASTDSRLVIPSSMFDWGFSFSKTDANNGSADLTLYTKTFNGTRMPEDSKIEIKVSNYGAPGRGSVRPKLLSQPSSVNVDFILNNFLLNVDNPHPSTGPGKTHDHHRVAPVSGFTAPRWAISLTAFSTEHRGSTSSMQHSSVRSLDDEYSPGVFELDEVSTPRGRTYTSLPQGGFMQWRPVSYLTSDRDVNKATLPTLTNPDTFPPPPANTTNVTTTATPAPQLSGWFSFINVLAADDRSELKPLTNISEALAQSLAFAMFGTKLTTDEMLAAETLVSFGSPDDGYYTTYNYTVWTFSSGSGSPPKEGLSTEVLIVILCGLGLPVVAMLVAGVGLLAWRLTRRRDSTGREALLENEEVTAQET